MNSEQRIARGLELLRADYESLGDGSFKHFICPIFLTDENVELCMGHVISQSMPNCCRKTVVQRKDIDGFYGSICEAAFKTLIEIHRAKAAGKPVLEEPKLRRVLPLRAKLGEQIVECYEAKQHTHPSHPIAELRDGDRKAFKLALKVSDAEIPSAGDLRLIVNRDFLPEMVATLLNNGAFNAIRSVWIPICVWCRRADVSGNLANFLYRE